MAGQGQDVVVANASERPLPPFLRVVIGVAAVAVVGGLLYYFLVYAPNAAAQPQCVEDRDCKDPKKICNADGKCVPDRDSGGGLCVSDADCDGVQGKPACNVRTGDCVACTEDKHCTTEARPRCATATHTCEPPVYWRKALVRFRPVGAQGRQGMATCYRCAGPCSNGARVSTAPLSSDAETRRVCQESSVSEWLFIIEQAPTSPTGDALVRVENGGDINGAGLCLYTADDPHAYVRSEACTNPPGILKIQNVRAPESGRRPREYLGVGTRFELMATTAPGARRLGVNAGDDYSVNFSNNTPKTDNDVLEVYSLEVLPE